MSEHKQSKILYRKWKEEDLLIIKDYYVRLDQYFRSLGMNMPEPEDPGQAWLDSFQRILGKYAMVHIAEMDGEVVGFILGRIKRIPEYWGGVMVGLLSDMFIDKKARRRGVARELLRLAAAWMRERDVHSLEIQVMHENEAAQKLFAEMGFKTEFHSIRLMWDEYTEAAPPENSEYDL